MSEDGHAECGCDEQPSPGDLPTVGRNVPGILRARETTRAILAPTGKDLEALMIRLHQQSALSQQKARKSQQEARDEINKRLEGKVVELDETGAVVVAIVTTRELIGVMEAESNLVKSEALAQRAYTVYRGVQQSANPAAGSIERFRRRARARRADGSATGSVGNSPTSGDFPPTRNTTLAVLRREPG